MQEKIIDKFDKHLTCQALSFRIPMMDLQKEKEFFTRMLGIIPLVDNDRHVIFPISNEMMLNLLATDPALPMKIASITPVFELDVCVPDFQKAWHTACRLYQCQEEALTVVGTRRSFEVISPSGIVLRFWQ